MKKNILYIDTGCEYGGGTKSFLYLLEYLDKSKFKPFVFFENDYIVDNKKISEIIEEKGGKFITFEKFNGISKLKKEFLRIISKDKLKKEIIKLKIEYVRKFFNSFNFKVNVIHLNNHFGTNLEYIYVSNELNIPVIQHLRKNSELSKIEIDILKNLNFNTISVSNATYNFYSKYLEIKNNIVYNPFLINSEEIQLNNKKIKILFPANYLENKGHFLVFKALENLENIELILAGDGKFDKKTLNLKNKLQNVRELGFIKNIDKFYKEVDYIISFSQNEGLPRVIIEGLLYGCGIISSDYDAVKEICELSEKRNFYIIKRNVKILRNLLQNLKPINYKIPDKKIKLIFSIENYINSIENLYKSLL
jgi:GalNAc-alpha-(1->4)-GalNAc-alpha-(1->3)-diNAcBac-PP-undecaprenol alpha-1,4-N-acetyl-D-galactosaminyltransferase